MKKILSLLLIIIITSTSCSKLEYCLVLRTQFGVQCCLKCWKTKADAQRDLNIYYGDVCRLCR